MPALHAVLALLLLALPSPEEPKELPPALETPFAEGVRALKSGRLDQAEAAFKGVLAGGGDLAFVHNNLGLVYQERGRHAQAIAAFREAIRRDPRYVAPRVGLGVSLSATGRLGEATRELEQALTLAPRETWVRLALANAYEKARNWPGVVEQYRALRELAPREPEYAYALGKAYLSLSEWCLRELRTIDGSAARLQQALGHNYRAQGRSDLALAALARAAQADPTLPEVHLAMAQILMEAEQWAEAREEIARELRLVPESAGARALLRRLETVEPKRP